MFEISIGVLKARTLPGDRYDLADIWRRMWGIHAVPLGMASVMAEPLLTIDQVAEMVDVTTHTIRRAGNTGDPKWNLPEHVDLGPRVRRYLPLHIQAWLLRSTPAPWLEKRRGPKGFAGLTPRAHGEGREVHMEK
jgi:predicted DNA-binding transcriptional regulator AlpA